MKFSSEGLVEGGIECGFWDGDVFVSEEVYDLVGWLKTQFALLREKYKNAPETLGRKPSTTRTIWLGGDEAPFGSLHANKSTFKIFFYHPEIVGLPENIGLFESPDIEKISSFIVVKAAKVSKFNWIGMIPKF